MWDFTFSRGEYEWRAIALMMEAVRTYEKSVNFNVTTWRYIPQESKLQPYKRMSTYKKNQIFLAALSPQEEHI
jgi:hypothetical protein